MSSKKDDLAVIDGERNQTVSARKLYEELEVSYSILFKDWFSWIGEAFTEGKDYIPCKFVHPQSQRKLTDYRLTSSMAEEIVKIWRTKKLFHRILGFEFKPIKGENMKLPRLRNGIRRNKL
jgi:phage anti-repressor protein